MENGIDFHLAELLRVFRERISCVEKMPLFEKDFWRKRHLIGHQARFQNLRCGREYNNESESEEIYLTNLSVA